MFIGGRAIAHTPDDTLQNAGQSEHVIGNVKIHILNAVASGMLAIKAGIFGGIGDIERVEINPSSVWVEAPSDGMNHCIR